MKPIFKSAFPLVLILTVSNLKAQDSNIQLKKHTPDADTITNKFVKRIEGFNSRMPIAKLESKDNMPVAGLQNSNDNKANMTYVPVSFSGDSTTLLSKINDLHLKIAPGGHPKDGNINLKLRMRGEK